MIKCSELITKVAKIKHREWFPMLQGQSKHASNFRTEPMNLGRSQGVLNDLRSSQKWNKFIWKVTIKI